MSRVCCKTFPTQYSYRNSRMVSGDKFIEVKECHNQQIIGASKRLREVIEIVESLNPVKMAQDNIDVKKSILAIQEKLLEVDKAISGTSFVQDKIDEVEDILKKAPQLENKIQEVETLAGDIPGVKQKQAELEELINKIKNRKEYDYRIERDQIFPRSTDSNVLTFDLPVPVHNVELKELSEQIDVYLNGVRIEDLSTNKNFTLEHQPGDDFIKITVCEDMFNPAEDQAYMVVPYIKKVEGEPYNYED